MRGKATVAHRPLLREKNLYLFSSFFTYTSKYKNVTLFFDWMSHNGSCIVSGQSAPKRLNNRVKKWLVHRVRSNAFYRIRCRIIPAFIKFCAVLHDVPDTKCTQSIILIRLDVTSLFRKTLVSTNESSETNIRLFFVAIDNEDRRRSWRTPLFLRQFDVLLLRTFWLCSAFYRSYFCCVRHVLGKERLLAKNRYKILAIYLAMN